MLERGSVHFKICPQGDFGTQKEAAWAISNLTISGRKEQVRPPSFLYRLFASELQFP